MSTSLSRINTSTLPMTREFDIGDILSITTGYTLSPRNIEGIADILAFWDGLEGGAVEIQGLGHAMVHLGKLAQVALRLQFPNLVIPDGLDSAAVLERAQVLREVFGDRLVVRRRESLE